MKRVKKYNSFILEKKTRFRDKTDNFKIKLKAKDNKEKDLFNDLIKQIETTDELKGVGGLADLFSKDIKINTDNGKASFEILGKPDITEGFKDDVINFLKSKRDGLTNVKTDSETKKGEGEIKDLKNDKTNYKIITTFNELKETYPGVWEELKNHKIVKITPYINEKRWEDVSDIYIPVINFVKSFFHLLWKKTENDYNNDEDKIGQWGDVLQNDIEKFQKEFIVKDENNMIGEKTWDKIAEIIFKDEKIDADYNIYNFEGYMTQKQETEIVELTEKQIQETPSNEILETAISKNIKIENVSTYKFEIDKVTEFHLNEHSEKMTDEKGIANNYKKLINNIIKDDPISFNKNLVDDILNIYNNDKRSTEGFVKDIISDFNTDANKISNGMKKVIQQELNKISQNKVNTIEKFIYTDEIHKMNVNNINILKNDIKKINDDITSLQNDLKDINDSNLDFEERRKKEVTILKNVSKKINILKAYYEIDEEMREIDEKSKKEISSKMDENMSNINNNTWLSLNSFLGYITKNTLLLSIGFVGFMALSVVDLWNAITNWRDDTEYALEIFLPFVYSGSKKFIEELKNAGVDTSSFESLFNGIKNKTIETKNKTEDFNKKYAKDLIKNNDDLFDYLKDINLVKTDSTYVKQKEKIKESIYFYKFNDFKKRT